MRRDTQEKIAQMHEQLVHIAQRCSQTAHSDYTADDIRKLQNKLSHIDQKYQEGILHAQSQQNISEDPYEIPGEAQIANELNIVHDAITSMLQNIEQQ
ncbi:uncharacterized protein BX664DRAFT_277988 [Halteromyces radiatus]|uniref:uncharacterized protein n=1 Tax=Halteromyces radiatus TaxID=101107 RepID=UPI00221FCCE5|nr:uncharacterized protein BX664DRAFT_277988 [Halteromyces radiatus]KAI8093186.1 hypothetical protein BX664DRAFT_277988 [Halteromyces radiatus]